MYKCTEEKMRKRYLNLDELKGENVDRLEK
jgi:hypothetical protein